MTVYQDPERQTPPLASFVENLAHLPVEASYKVWKVEKLPNQRNCHPLPSRHCDLLIGWVSVSGCENWKVYAVLEISAGCTQIAYNVIIFIQPSLVLSTSYSNRRYEVIANLGILLHSITRWPTKN